MLFIESFFAALVFIALLVGVVAIYLGKMNEVFYLDKTRTETVAIVCFLVSLIWLLSPIFVPIGGGVLLFVFIVALVFYLASRHFYRRSDLL